MVPMPGGRELPLVERNAIPQLRLSNRERTTASHDQSRINKSTEAKGTLIRFQRPDGIFALRRGWESYLPGILQAKLAASSVLPCPM